MMNITGICCNEEGFGNCAMRLLIQFDNDVTESHNREAGNNCADFRNRKRHNDIRLYLEERECLDLLSSIADEFGDCALFYVISGVAYGSGARVLDIICALANDDKDVLNMVNNALGNGSDLTAADFRDVLKSAILDVL